MGTYIFWPPHVGHGLASSSRDVLHHQKRHRTHYHYYHRHSRHSTHLRPILVDTHVVPHSHLAPLRLVAQQSGAPTTQPIRDQTHLRILQHFSYMEGLSRPAHTAPPSLSSSCAEIATAVGHHGEEATNQSINQSINQVDEPGGIGNACNAGT